MCDLSDGFKLCTCADDGPFDWTLYRVDTELPTIEVQGSVFFQPPTDEDLLDQARVLERLNSAEPFDKPIPVGEGDVFRIRLDSTTHCFRHDGTQWVPDDDDPFAPWQHQLETKRAGFIELPGDAIPEQLLITARAQPRGKGASVLRDWILAEGHPDLKECLEAIEADEEPYERSRVSPRRRMLLEDLFSPSGQDG